MKQPTVEERQKQADKLESMLQNLSPSIEREEAKELARDSIYYSYTLARNYELLAPPLWHNTLVNIGFKKRGLCHQWSSDLLAYLLAKKYKSFKFYKVSANIGQYSEHNALSVSVNGGDLNESIILDPWRNSGHLYFIEIKKDKEYKWRER